MSILSSLLENKRMILNELEVNGQEIDPDDNYDMDDEEETANTPEEEADNAAEEAGDDVTGEDGYDQEDDFTLTDDDPEQEIENTEEAPAEENTEGGDDADDNFDMTDDEADAPAEDTGDGEADTSEADTGTDEGGDDNFDMADGGEGGDEGAAEDAGGENTNQENNNAPQAPTDPTDGISDDDIKASEEQIYDSLTDEQKSLRVIQLKKDYKELYTKILTTIDGVGNIPKTMDNLNTIKRLISFLTRAKNILIDYVDINFDKNSYMENYANYIKYMALLRTTSEVINNMPY